MRQIISFIYEWKDAKLICVTKIINLKNEQKLEQMLIEYIIYIEQGC